MIDLWLGGEAADHLRAYCEVTHKEPEAVLADLALLLNPEIIRNGNGHYTVICGSCGKPFMSARKPREWKGERVYCSAPCRADGAAARMVRYRQRRSASF